MSGTYLTDTMPTYERICMIDPSELLRPEPKFASKPIGHYRDYSINTNDPLKERVRKTYTAMHTYQSVQFVQDKIAYWTKFDKFRGTIMDTLLKLNDLVDESDPDVNIPNIVHAFQTAERIREEHPDKEWFHLTGLIHDLGKIMAFFNEPQWAVVGDTFPVGCAWADSIVYRETTFANNPDTYNPMYRSKYGIYRPNCGLDNVVMSWGHDEYMYRMLIHNKCTLPDEALYMIRFHSFYPWHTGGDYDHLCSVKDFNMKEWVLEFNKYDLYTKGGKMPDVDELKPYYQKLIDKYIPGELDW